MKALRHYLLAVQFFTRVPVTGRLAHWVGYSPAMLRASAGHFPGVGFLVGGVLACFTALLMAYLPGSPFAPLVAAGLGCVLSVMMTGGFHEDGLADIADGLGGSFDRERALIIMKDSRVGAFGALALVLAITVKVALLALLGSVSVSVLLGGIFFGHVVSRGWPLALLATLAHVGDAAGSKSKPLADRIGHRGLLTGAAWCALAVLGLWLVRPELMPAMAGGVLASGLGAFYMARLLWRRLQGFTGDGLGATQQVCELTFYLGLALSL